MTPQIREQHRPPSDDGTNRITSLEWTAAWAPWGLNEFDL